MLQELLIEVPLAIIGTIGFSILFGVAPRHYLPCGLNGGFSWLVYKVAFAITLTVPAATFAAALALTTMSRTFAVYFKAPTTIFLYGGIFTVVPGTGIYAIAYKLFLGQTLEGFLTAADTMKTAVAIALGIGVSYMIPPKVFGRWKRSLSIESSEDGDIAPPGPF